MKKKNRLIGLLWIAITTGLVGPANADTPGPLAELDSTGVPVYSDDLILAQFKLIRETKYLYEADNKSTPPRRLPWMEPSGWCDARADLAYDLIAKDSRFSSNPPWFISTWMDGDFTLLTPYLKSSSLTEEWKNGEASWSGHIAVAVKNMRGEVIVLDPAINPCLPLKLNDWLDMLVGKSGGVSVYYQEPSVYKVSLFDPKGTSALDYDTHKRQIQNINLVDERAHLSSLSWSSGKVEQMLGDYPPWRGNTCISISRSFDLPVPVNVSSHTVALCPAGTLAIGGGFSINSNSIPMVGTGNLGDSIQGWWADTNYNYSGTTPLSAVSAMCLAGAPANAKVTTVFGSYQAVGPSSTVTSTAKCSSGLLVGGGFETAKSGSVARVFKNKKSTTQSNTWEVAAYNPGSQASSIQAYALCLNNTSYTVETAIGTLNTDGIAKATCEGMLHAMGGGFEFPQNKAYNVVHMNNIGTNQVIVKMTPAPQSGDLTAKAYAMCLRSDSDPPFMCTAKTAVDMGASSTKVTKVAGNGCLKITTLPSWAKSISLQSQGSGVKYPIPYTWTNCSTTGNQTFTGNWVTQKLSPTISECTTLIRLTGSSASTVYLKWWPNS